MENISLNIESHMDANKSLNGENVLNEENITNNLKIKSKPFVSTLNLTKIENQPLQISLKNKLNYLNPMKRTYETFNENYLKRNKENQLNNNHNSKADSFLKKKLKFKSTKNDKIYNFSNIKDNKNSKINILKNTKAKTEIKIRLNNYSELNLNSEIIKKEANNGLDQKEEIFIFNPSNIDDNIIFEKIEEKVNNLALNSHYLSANANNFIDFEVNKKKKENDFNNVNTFNNRSLSNLKINTEVI